MAQIRPYLVVSPTTIVIEEGGRTTSYSPGQTFQVLDSNLSVKRLLENGSIVVSTGEPQSSGFVVVTGPEGPQGPTGPVGPAASNVLDFIHAQHTAGVNIPSGAATVVDFETVVTDPNTSVTTGSGWVWTAPADGKAQLSTFVGFGGSQSWSAGFITHMQVFKNGSSYAFIGYTRIERTTSSARELYGSTTIDVTAGDTLDVRVFQNLGGNRALTTTAISCWVTITLLG